VGIGWIEISVFVGMFVMSTIGIGFMHRYFVHRSFRCGPVMRTILAATPRIFWPTRSRFPQLRS
jgi:stearoyl-CoA desaturase (Delta-9 desaturase)